MFLCTRLDIVNASRIGNPPRLRMGDDDCALGETHGIMYPRRYSRILRDTDMGVLVGAEDVYTERIGVTDGDGIGDRYLQPCKPRCAF